MTPEAYRARLPRVYDALIARHGGPNEVQLAAAEPLLAGRDVLVSAPTASGKTEAYTGPLCQLHAGEGTERARILVVCPTRALANDLARRLQERLGRVGIDVGRWTGDHHDGGRLHELTVLTPEGLDSRLSRRPDAVANVRAVVLDELHVLDGTARGDQLRVLVQRLRVEPRGTLEGKALPLQVVAASATVADPPAMAARYLDHPALVVVGDRRPVRARIVEGTSPATVHRELLEQVRRGYRKVLAFCNTREEVETLARFLFGQRPFGGSVVAHHGSLSRQERLGAEQRFCHATTALCVATSTLEVGLDIGDVDLVALVGAPPDVASLLQRVGRGGRRTPVNPVVAFVRGPFEASCLRTLLRAQAAGEWLAGPTVFHPSVLVQQAVSILQARGSRTVDAGALARRLPSDLRGDWPPARLEGVLEGAANRDLLALVGQGSHGPVYGLGPVAERLWARGELHGNLAERRGVEVVDGLTGDVIGQLSQAHGRVGLGGRERVELSGDERRVVVRSAGPGPLAAAPTFGSGSPFPLPATLATALLSAAGVPIPGRWSLDEAVALFHGLGRTGGMLLAGVLRLQRVVGSGRGKVVRSGPFALMIEGRPRWERWPEPAAVDAALGAGHRGLAASVDMGRFHGALPDSEQRLALAVAAEVERVRALVAGGLPPLLEPPDADTADLWREAALS